MYKTNSKALQKSVWSSARCFFYGCLDHSRTTPKGQQSTATPNHRQRYKTLISGDIADFLQNCPNGYCFMVTFCLQIGVCS